LRNKLHSLAFTLSYSSAQIIIIIIIIIIANNAASKDEMVDVD